MQMVARRMTRMPRVRNGRMQQRADAGMHRERPALCHRRRGSQLLPQPAWTRGGVGSECTRKPSEPAD